MLTRIRLANPAQISIDSCISRTFISVDHCCRTPPPFRPDAPHASVWASSTTICLPGVPCAARLYAIESPITPAPTMTVSTDASPIFISFPLPAWRLAKREEG